MRMTLSIVVVASALCHLLQDIARASLATPAGKAVAAAAEAAAHAAGADGGGASSQAVQKAVSPRNACVEAADLHATPAAGRSTGHRINWLLRKGLVLYLDWVLNLDFDS